MSGRFQRQDQGDEGLALITLLMIGMVVMALASVLFSDSLAELNGSSRDNRRATSMQAAEAGLNDYIAKLTEDRLYYAHRLHIGESTRLNPATNTTTAAGSAWAGDLTWSYPNGHDAWRSLGNGYEYNLQVTPPLGGSPEVRVVASGRKAGSSKELRTVEERIRPSSVADYQMIANADITYGNTATTRGKIYAGIDAGGTKHNIAHFGTAYADLYAEGSITQAPTYVSPAVGYNSTNIRTVIKNPINFNNFTGSLVTIQRAATVGNMNFNDATAGAWRIVFSSAGTMSVAKCTKSGGADPADTAPNCATPATYPVPTNGAVYTGQTAVVSGIVKGRVTIASNDDVVIADNISYQRPGTDVLGLIARNEVLVPLWAPNNLDWRAATIAQTGQWRSYTGNTTKNSVTFTGSTATAGGGYMSMYATRTYNYDPTLLYLAPPYFPVLEDAYTVVLFRELPAGGN
jgi:Tfp pilus assembly protein PilX